MAESVDILDETTVPEVLCEHGLIGPGATARALSGGVSNVVMAVTEGDRRMVVKQALPRLRVADEWLAPVSRVLAEADALAVTGQLTPTRVPSVIATIPSRYAIVIAHAPVDWTDWKSALLAGVVDEQVAAWLGDTLAIWHEGTRAMPLPPRLEDDAAFELLRVDPYLRTVAARHPRYQAEIAELIAELARRRACLVHGDFSPKNVLVGEAGAGWVVDFEVAHRGDPAFDVAFMLSHLQLKAIHLPDHEPAIDACARAFVEHYTRTAEIDWPHTARLVGALLLARVAGKSPAEYLDQTGRDRAWHVGGELLTHDLVDLAGLLERRGSAVAP